MRGNGSLDRAFGRDGVLRVRPPKGSLDHSAFLPLDQIVVLPDGRLMVAGGERGRGLVVARYLATGRLDHSYGDGGIARVRFRAWGFTQGFDASPNGRAIVSGTIGHRYGKMGVACLRPDGSLDSRFGRGGEARVTVGSSSSGGPVFFESPRRVILTGWVRQTPPLPGGTAVVRLGLRGAVR